MYCPIKKMIDKTIKVVIPQNDDIFNPLREILLSNRSVTSDPITT
jgi:hypothetical protein